MSTLVSGFIFLRDANVANMSLIFLAIVVCVEMAEYSECKEAKEAGFFYPLFFSDLELAICDFNFLSSLI